MRPTSQHSSHVLLCSLTMPHLHYLSDPKLPSQQHPARGDVMLASKPAFLCQWAAPADSQKADMLALECSLAVAPGASRWSLI